MEEVNDPWMDDDSYNSYTCDMVNANIDDDIREDPLLADILMAVQEDNSYKEASLAVRQGLAKEEVKHLPSGHGAR